MLQNGELCTSELGDFARKVCFPIGHLQIPYKTKKQTFAAQSIFFSFSALFHYHGVVHYVMCVNFILSEP